MLLLLLLSLHLLRLQHTYRLCWLCPKRVVTALPLLSVALTVKDRQRARAKRLDAELAVLIVGVEREVLNAFLA